MSEEKTAEGRILWRLKSNGLLHIAAGTDFKLNESLCGLYVDPVPPLEAGLVEGPVARHKVCERCLERFDAAG